MHRCGTPACVRQSYNEKGSFFNFNAKVTLHLNKFESMKTFGSCAHHTRCQYVTELLFNLKRANFKNSFGNKSMRHPVGIYRRKQTSQTSDATPSFFCDIFLSERLPTAWLVLICNAWHFQVSERSWLASVLRQRTLHSENAP